jgi:4-amino-4-deoxy-L-arabinose transferase-like glycosyltransferase
MLLGAPQIMTALAAGVTTLCTFHLVKLLFDSRTARLAAVLLAISPLFVFASATLLSQTPATMFITAGALGYLNSLRGEGWRAWAWAALAGLCFAWSFYCRPASAGILGFVLVHAAHRVLASRGRALVRLWPALLGAALPVAVFGGIEASLGGSPLYTLPESGNKDLPGLGLNVSVGGVIFSPLLAASNLLDGLLKLNLWGLGWPVSLLFPAVALVFGRRRVVLPLAGAAACHLVVMGLYWSSGIGDISPIYHVVLVPMMAALAAHGVLLAWDRLRGSALPWLGRAVPALVLALCILATPIAWYLQAASLIAVTERVRAPYELLEAEGITDNAVVFYQQPRPRPSWVLSIPVSHHPFTDPMLYFFDRGRKHNQIVKRMFPGRRGYRLALTKPGPRWALQRLWDKRLMRKGPPVMGDRKLYREAHPYPAFKRK